MSSFLIIFLNILKTEIYFFLIKPMDTTFLDSENFKTI
jgi:hypothetical protein